jgi:hypothetical protein
VDFSEARDIFVNIFSISDLTAKFVDRGLISENLRGLSAKSAKSRPWVDFTKVQGPLCKISKIIRIMNYFPMVNPVHQVHVSVDRPGVLGPPWTDAGADRGHGGALTMERGARGTRLGSHRSSGGAVEAGRRRCRTGRRRRSMRGLLRQGEREIGAGRGAVKLGEGAHLL